MLIDSLETEADDDASEAWTTKNGQRVEDVEQGRVQLIPWFEMCRRMLPEFPVEPESL